MSLGIDLQSKYFYIVDIRYKQKTLDLSKYIVDKKSEIMALTPYSNYLLDNSGFEYSTFHTLVMTVEKFHKLTLEKYQEIEFFFSKCREYSFLFRDIAFILTYEIYIELLFKFLENKRNENYKIVYITDSSSTQDNDMNLTSNDKSCIWQCKSIEKFIYINNKNLFFYKVKNLEYNFLTLVYRKNILKKIFDRYVNPIKNKVLLSYDNVIFQNIYSSLKPVVVDIEIPYQKINIFLSELEKYLIREEQLSFISNLYIELLVKFKNTISSQIIPSSIKIHPFVFLSNNQNYFEILLYENNKIPKIFMQHGSYLQENIFLKYGEIYPADINFVFNDFTKKLFEKKGAKKAYSVGSINFNYQILEKEKKYDFLYIIYCTSYSYSGMQIFSDVNLLSVDAKNIFERHAKTIELFGKKFKDKKLCIKIQAGIFRHSMLYVPFLELSREYINIDIEFVVPISKLIEKSKYIISDYFSSEFTNRELHYKRDIILFQGAPILLPEETIEDMDKMFILVETVDDLKDKVENIEKITKSRKRYDDIIERYSSKKCNTRKITIEILEKEFELSVKKRKIN
ncbi:MAG: hypothetical protein WC667_02470 [Sulfurimonas sp.]